MSGKRTLLEKRMKNRAFRRTEEKILEAFIKGNDNLSMTKMAKKAGVGRSTLYVHHHATKEILPDYERYMLVEYAAVAKKRLRMKNVQIKSLYFDMLIFILQNRKNFNLFLEFGRTEVFEKMIEKLENKIVAAEGLPKNSKKVFRIYAGEVTKVIVDWCEKGFSDKEIMRTLTDIMYLTDSAGKRLSPLEH